MTSTAGETFGSWMRSERGKAKMTQREVAHALTRSEQYICDLEQDRRLPPAPDFIVAWAAVIDADPHAAIRHAVVSHPTVKAWIDAWHEATAA